VKPKIDYLIQRTVNSVSYDESNDRVKLYFEGGAIVSYNDFGSPNVVGLSLLQTRYDLAEDETFATFGRSRADKPPVDVTEIRLDNFTVDIPGFVDEERDLSIPEHPDDRVAEAPVEPQE